jgi:hypothetical protein
MSSLVNKNIKTSGGKTTDNHKLVCNMMTADETADNKNFGGDGVDAKTGGDDVDDENIDDDASTKTGSNADDKNTIGAGIKETNSSDGEVMLDPVSKAALLYEYDAQWPKTPSVPSSRKMSVDLNVDDNNDAVDDGKEYSMEDIANDANEVDAHHPNEQN